MIWDNRLATAAFSLVLVSATSVGQGVWTGRWQTARNLSPVVARLNDISMTVGEWQGRSAPIDSKEIAQAGAAGSLMRTYEHTTTGEIVTVLLIVGRPGPVSVHSPDVCYPAAGYEPEGPPTRCRLNTPDGHVAEFWRADYRKENTGIPDRLRIYWAWRGRDGWSAPVSPRLTFAYEEFLYKIYVVRPLSPAVEEHAVDPSAQFIESFMTAFKYQDATSSE